MRRPKQVLVFLYKKINNDYFYCIFLRKNNIWQGISGGVEDDEGLIDTVKREVLEETGISVSNVIELSSVASIPVVDVVGEFKFGEDLYVIPEYSFGVECNGDIVLSSEHMDYKWLSYDEAINCLEYDSNKTALWELNCRLK
jgi:dATP pyrophosphohydrolase